ncbi:hypothetical protein PVAND_017157 [Polypedilum vanderplanki]|uniref:Uncharacterized protein n=1 Tax=Polypedilum vanderplanki TaxID=319348 RepID=A0A9J6BHT1_POLVA|nr:hypothetical protein PVAND_017157 [Polypedilum vanderplanki]
MKSTLKIIILLSSILISINGKLIFKKIDCSADSEWICLKQCYVSETHALNVIGSIIKPLTNPFEIQFTLSKLDGSTSTLVFDTQIEWCSFMNGNGNNPIFTQLVAIIKNVLPKLIHECPYCGDFEVKNLKFDEAMNLAASAFFPIGELKVETGLLIQDSSIFNLTIIIESKLF